MSTAKNAAAPFAACRGIVFDLDDTLYDRQPALSRLFEAWWGPLSERDWNLIKPQDARGHSIRVEFFSFLKERYPVPDASGAELWERYQREFPAHIRVDDTLPVLRRLARTDLVQSILTNGGSQFQRAKYHAAGLAEFIGPDRVFVSGEIGRDKPDPITFHHVCAALKLAPHELLFVGDHPEKDIAGARAVGFSTCWFQRDEREHADADATIRSLSELLPLLGLD